MNYFTLMLKKLKWTIRREFYPEQNGPFAPYYVPSANDESKIGKQESKEEPRLEPEPRHKSVPIPQEKQNVEPLPTLAPKTVRTK